MAVRGPRSPGVEIQREVVHDLPQVAVGITEVPGVDAPGAVAWLAEEGRARRLGGCEQLLHGCCTPDRLAGLKSQVISSGTKRSLAP
jgi:hypothetical protein